MLSDVFEYTPFLLAQYSSDINEDRVLHCIFSKIMKDIQRSVLHLSVSVAIKVCLPQIADNHGINADTGVYKQSRVKGNRVYI